MPLRVELKELILGFFPGLIKFPILFLVSPVPSFLPFLEFFLEAKIFFVLEKMIDLRVLNSEEHFSMRVSIVLKN